MTTLATMIAEIEDDLERSDTTAIRTKIQAAIRHYQSERFFFNESRDITFNTVAAQTDYAFGAAGDITTEFYKIDGVFLTEGTNVICMKLADYRAFETLLDGTSTSGTPVLYTYVNRALRLYPSPDGIYSTRLTGHIKLAAPAGDDTADNEWMTEAYDLIMAHAKALLFAKRYRDIEGAAIETTAAKTYLDELKAKSNTKIGSGNVRPTQF